MQISNYSLEHKKWYAVNTTYHFKKKEVGDKTVTY